MLSNDYIAGYGMTTPRTMSGRLCVIVYGLVGCGACMLFFNLFMERTVTVFAICLRKWSNYKVRECIRHRSSLVRRIE